MDLKPLQNYIVGQSNTQLLQYYAFKELRPKWPQCKNIAEVISEHLDKTLSATFDSNMYDRWQLTATNIAEMNKIIWTALKASVTKTLESTEADPEKAIQEMLDSKQRFSKENRESVTFEPVSVRPEGWN